MSNNIAKSLTELIGNTPLLELQSYAKANDLNAIILAKLESFNPGGSVKDRVAYAMITDAETKGSLQPGGVIIEPTSGNTGIGLAWVAKAKGYKLILTMPETMSIERRKLLHALGAEIVLTPGAQGMKGAIAEAERLQQSTTGAIILGQFNNPANPAIHRATTAPEIWNATNGNFDIFISAAGTGGTVTGVGSFIKEKNPNIKVVVVEPAESPVLSGGKPGSHRIQGIGAGFIPEIYDKNVIDEILPVSSNDAFNATRQLAITEGALVGISSGAALHAATVIARRPENAGKRIVAILPDTGERYLSTPLFD
jgi:cysteine synthase A